MKIQKVVFLDRDGVLNALVERNSQMVSPRLFMEFRILDGVPEAIDRLLVAGYELVVVTNQPDISRGLMDHEELDKMNDVVTSLGIRDILVCPHSDEDGCLCRKPKPGLLTQYLERVPSKPSEMWMVGDKQSDVKVGLAIGARTILIGEKCIIGESRSSLHCPSLSLASYEIIRLAKRN